MGTKVVIVGGGSPTPSIDRFGSAVAIYEGERGVMVDCGPGTTYKMLRNKLTPKTVESVLLTHLHFDHTSDFATLALVRWETRYTERHSPLSVVGPSGTRSFVERLIGDEGAFRPDVMARRDAPLSQAKFTSLGGELPRPDLEFTVTELSSGESAHVVEGLEVRAISIPHVQPHHDSLAFRLNTREASIVVTGDGEVTEDLITLAQGADLLVAQCVDVASRFNTAGELAKGQMATSEVGRMAKEAGVRAVVLTHIAPERAVPGPREQMIREVAAVFDGHVFFGFEGLEVGIDAASVAAIPPEPMGQH